MELGIGSYSLAWAIGVPGYEAPADPLTAAGLIRKAAENSIRVVQIADNLPLHRMDTQELGNIRKEADKHGIILEVGTRGTEPALLLEYLSIAGRLGSKLLRTIITIPDMAEAEENLRLVLPGFAAEGIAIAVENHGLHRTEQLCGLFDSLDSPWIGSCLDTVNSFSGMEYPEQVIRRLAPHGINLHVKDFEIKRHRHQMGFEIIGTPAGAGRLDMDLLLEYIKRYGRNPNCILELWTPWCESIGETVELEEKWFIQSLQFLKDRLKREAAAEFAGR